MLGEVEERWIEAMFAIAIRVAAQSPKRYAGSGIQETSTVSFRTAALHTTWPLNRQSTSASALRATNSTSWGIAGSTHWRIV
jgi:hypothetical protein